MSEHRYDIRISESCIDPNPFMVERQDPDNFTRFQTRERCALEIAAYVFKINILIFLFPLWGRYVGPIWDPSGQNAYGITLMIPMRNPVALPIWVAHMGPIVCIFAGCN